MMTLTPQRLRGCFTLKLVLAAIVVAVGDFVLFQKVWLAGGIGLFLLAALAAMVAAQPAVLRDGRARIAIGLAAVFAAVMLYQAHILPFLLFWVAAGMALLLPRTAAFDDGWRWFQRLVVHGVISVLGPIPDLVRRTKARSKRSVPSVGWKQVVPVLVLPVMGTLVFVWLFSAANPVIADWLGSFDWPDLDDETIVRVLLWLVLLWTAWSLLRPHAATHLFGTFDGSGDRVIPGVSPASVTLSLIAFNAVFLLQNAMDAAWLWGLLPLPESMTLAQYAHRSAYPLVATALLTALFVLVALRPGSTTARTPLIRALVIGWIAQNLFLVFNAGLRTMAYVEAYSLTVLRIAALLWMGLVAIGLVLVLWRMLAGKSSSWLINTNLAALGMLLSVVCFVDLGAVAAQWNVRHASEVGGNGAQLDLCYLNQLDGSALLPLIELEQRNLGGQFGERVRNVRLAVHHDLIRQVKGGSWDWTSVRRLRQAEEKLGGNIGPQLGRYSITCSGAEYPEENPVAPDFQSPVDGPIEEAPEGPPAPADAWPEGELDRPQQPVEDSAREEIGAALTESDER